MVWKIGSTAVTALNIGSTNVTKAYRGSTEVFPGGGNPPAASVLEGFEGTPLTGDLTWTKTFQDFAVSTCTVTSSVLHVTQGSNSWKFVGDTSSSNRVGIETSSPLNLSGYTTISIDIYVETVATNDAVIFYFQDAGGNNLYAGPFTTLSTTGAYTLTANIADIATAGISTSAVYVSFFGFMLGSGGASVFYADNLRAA